MRTIVWDVDDVLNSLMHAWFTSEFQPAHPESAVRYEDISDNPPFRSLGISRAEYLTSLDAFRASERSRKMAPNRAVLAWLQDYGSEFRHVALTARPLESAPAAAEWVFRHFGDYFRCFGVVPSRPGSQTPLYDRHKGDFLEWLGQADFLVDDSLENVALAQKAGVRGILWPQPWNGATYSPDEVLAVLSGDKHYACCA